MKKWAAGAALALALTACGSDGSEDGSESKEPETIRVRGTIAVKDAETLGVTCAPAPGYDDIAPGAEVVVRDASGKSVGLGKLGPGRAEGRTCTYGFDVSGVPAGDKIYSVEIANRGEVSFKEDESEDVALSLG